MTYGFESRTDYTKERRIRFPALFSYPSTAVRVEESPPPAKFSAPPPRHPLRIRRPNPRNTTHSTIPEESHDNLIIRKETKKAKRPQRSFPHTAPTPEKSPSDDTGHRLAPVPRKFPERRHKHDSAPRTKNIRANDSDAAPPSVAQSPEMQPTELRPKNRTAAG